MTDFFVDKWPLFASVGAVIATLVVFGKNLADLILKWRDVLSVPSTKEQAAEPSLTTSSKDGDNQSVIRDKQFEAIVQSLNNGNIQKFRLKKEGRELEYREVLQLWENDEEFLNFYISIFKKCGFNSYIWETPPISTDTANQPFEFALLIPQWPRKAPILERMKSTMI